MARTAGDADFWARTLLEHAEGCSTSCLTQPYMPISQLLRRFTVPRLEYNPLRSRYCEEAQGVTTRPHGPDARAALSGKLAAD